ncbi:MAG: transposase [Armatimonadetes bacterium]|nr:transposase [Armatimonadota bacterium]
MGLSVWCHDQAGPFPTVPYTGPSWQPEGKAACQPHEYQRAGTVKLLTLLHPAEGQVRVKGTASCTNTILHGWLKAELTAILQTLPGPAIPSDPTSLRTVWEGWQADLTIKPTLLADVPPLRMLLILDNLAGHKTPAFVGWLFAHGIRPLYTPLGGSWLNMAESIQRILKRRALNGPYPTTPEQITAWFEAVAAHWNQEPTPFEWGGKRQARRQRQRERRHALGGSGAYTRTPIRRRPTLSYAHKHDK